MTVVSPNVGIIGTHVEQSLSPVMHNAAYQEMGLDLQYGVFSLPIERIPSQRRSMLRAFLRDHQQEEVIGFSVTTPFKEDLLSIREEVDASAYSTVRIGAANTLSQSGYGPWCADNTDWLGAVRAIEEIGIDIEGATAAVIGAGGTAKAIAYGLGMRGANQVLIANRTGRKASELGRTLGAQFRATDFVGAELDGLADDGNISAELMSSLDIIFNATTVGQAGTEAASEMPGTSAVIDRLKPDAVVADAVYMPLETPFLRYARERGDLRIVNGTRMLLFQAVEQVKIFTGEYDIPVQAMDRALQAEVHLRQSSH